MSDDTFADTAPLCFLYGPRTTGHVDIAAGLLEHPSGARAKGLLSWHYGQAGWKMWLGAGGKALLKTVIEEGKDWRIQRKHP